MPRSIVLGNGNMLVGLDEHGIVRDFFFDFVGQENHVGGHRHHIGIWVDGVFSWLEDESWRKEFRYEADSMIGLMSAVNDSLGVTLRFHDFVYNEKNIFLRKVVVANDRSEERKVRLFFHQEFQIFESPLANSAFYEISENIIVHYKGRRVFMLNGRVGERGMTDYAIGTAHYQGLEGTWRDAEDGVLSKNPVAHGSVDSTVGFHFTLAANGSQPVWYWVAAAHSLVEAHELNRYVLERKPDHLLETTKDFWNAWIHMRKWNFRKLPKEVAELFKTSLIVTRTHVDNRGAIIASADSDFLQHGRDTYAYMWPRDGAFVAQALDNAGYFENSHGFFQFCNSVVMPDGYLMHKYLCDQSLGSSWHPWVGTGHPHLPIQEDETALALIALYNHYDKKRDLEFIESIYNSFIKPAGNFLMEYRHERTNLPRPSYNLWEEQRAIFTFTAASAYSGLVAASKFARLMGKKRQGKNFERAAEEIRDAILKYLFDRERGIFLKSIRWTEAGQEIKDATIDASSAFGIMEFGVLPVDDPRLTAAMEATKAALWVKGPVGGMARYAGDVYFRGDPETPGNPWIICTLWYAQYLIRKAKHENDLAEAMDILSWTVKHAQKCGILSEQLHPVTGYQLSAAPLIWSHAAFILTVIDYLKKLQELGLSEECVPV